MSIEQDIKDRIIEGIRGGNSFNTIKFGIGRVTSDDVFVERASDLSNNYELFISAVNWLLDNGEEQPMQECFHRLMQAHWEAQNEQAGN